MKLMNRTNNFLHKYYITRGGGGGILFLTLIILLPERFIQHRKRRTCNVSIGDYCSYVFREKFPRFRFIGLSLFPRISVFEKSSALRREREEKGQHVRR